MKYLSIIYFLVLFAIFGSYLVFSLPDNSQRLHVATASQLSGTQHNKIIVYARDIDTGSRFSGYSIETHWVPAPDAQEHLLRKGSAMEALIADGMTVREKLPENGELVMQVPDIPTVEVSALMVSLIDSDNNVRKRAWVPASVFNQQPVIQTLAVEEPKDVFFSAVVPASFIFNQSNEVMLAIFEHHQPWNGTLKIEQTYGPKANYLNEIPMNGLGHLKIAIPAACDFKLTAGEYEFYTTFVPNEKPIHAVIDSPVMTPEHRPVLSVTPVGTMPDITVDYFDENAFIGRQVIPANQARSAELELDYVYGNTPSVFYARVSASSIGTPDSSQTFPIIASKEAVSDYQQAAIALKLLKTWSSEHPEADYLSSLLSKSKKQSHLIRDYAFALASTHHAPVIEMRVKTESAEQQAFEARKSEQKSVMNVVLVAWFGLGLLVSLVLVIRNHRKRRQMWDEILASGNAEVGDVPPQTSGFMLFCLLILFVGFMVSLYFMMQIV